MSDECISVETPKAVYTASDFQVCEDGRILGDPNLRSALFELACLLRDKNKQVESLKQEHNLYKYKYIEAVRKVIAFEDYIKKLILKSKTEKITTEDLSVMLPDYMMVL